VKAKTRSDEDASIQRSGGWCLAASPLSHPSALTRVCTTLGVSKVSSHLPVEIKAKMAKKCHEARRDVHNDTQLRIVSKEIKTKF
jgi:hypothetical protein